ncbi:MAG TPA: phage protein Gp36 family protein [Polyangiaceae bacterium]|nr:phage protein Gp36 family protein [Polyangiaceae bacterium]
MAYASITDVQNLGVPAQAIGFLTDTQQNAILQSASDYADTFFRARWGTHAVPLLAWDSSVTEAVAKIAAYRMIRVRGFKSNASADNELRQGHDDAVNWLHLVQRQQAHPSVTVAQANAPGSQQPLLISSSVVNVLSGSTGPNRGW